MGRETLPHLHPTAPENLASHYPTTAALGETSLVACCCRHCERCAAYGRRQTLSTTDLSLRWLPTLRCILAMPRLNPTMRRALGCALRCLDPTYPDSPLGPSQDASLASQCGNRGSNSKLRSLLPPSMSVTADVERQDSHCLAEAPVHIACFLAALWRRRTNNFERDVVSARGPAEERTGVPSLRPRWNTAGGNTNV